MDGPHGFFKTFGGTQGNPEALINGAESGFSIMRIFCKPFPACALNQETMLMAVSLGQKGIAARDIEQVVICRPSGGLASFNAPGVPSEPPYTNMLQAQMAAKFTVVASLLGRPVEELEYYRDSYDDPEVAEVARRTALVTDDQKGAGVGVSLTNGQQMEISQHVTDQLKPTMTMMHKKFQHLASPALGHKTQQVLETIASLDRIHDIRDLTSLLQGNT